MDLDTKKSGRGLALLAKIGRAKPKSKPGMGGTGEDKSVDSDSSFGESMDGGADSETMDASSMATDDLAESLGVPEEKRAEFTSAFKAAVKSCMSSSGSDSGEPDEDDSSAGGLGL